MTDNHPVRNGIIATVVGGLVLAGVLGLLPQAWQLLLDIVRVEVTARVALLGVSILCAVGILVVTRRSSRRVPLAPLSTLTPSREPPRFDNLEPVQQLVLQVLVRADGDEPRLTEVAHITKTENIRIEDAVESLESMGLVERSYNYVHGTGVRLTSAGRRFAIDNNLIGSGQA